MKRVFFLGTVALFVTVLAACGGSSQPGYPVTPLAPERGGPRFAPDFKMVAYQGEEALGGKEVPLSSLFSRNPGEKKPVVLNFWAGACPPCRVEMPDLQEVHEEYRDRVLLVGLDVGPFVGLGSREQGQALLKELGVTYPAGTTFDAEVVRNYNVLGMPSTYFIKPNGELFRTWTGLLNKKKLTELVEELLAKSKDLS
jgi:thiol-disulfide isomerase/thioredoxin